MGTDGNEIRIILVEILAVETGPTRFEKATYIRIGTSLKPSVDYKEKKAQLRTSFNTVSYELWTALSNASEEETTPFLDHTRYYNGPELPISDNREKISGDFKEEKFIELSDTGRWNATNYGVPLFAKSLKKFEGLPRRDVRVIQYRDIARSGDTDEQTFDLVYAASFKEVIKYIMIIIPHEKIIGDEIRKKKTVYPEVAIQELLTDAIIHQALE